MAIQTRLVHGVHSDPRAVNFDLVGVHGGVGNQDLRILDHLWLPHPDLLVQDESTRYNHKQAVTKMGGGGSVLSFCMAVVV